MVDLAGLLMIERFSVCSQQGVKDGPRRSEIGLCLRIVWSNPWMMTTMKQTFTHVTERRHCWMTDGITKVYMIEVKFRRHLSSIS